MRPIASANMEKHGHYCFCKKLIDFQNIYCQNGAFIAIPWGPASKSPLNQGY